MYMYITYLHPLAAYLAAPSYTTLAGSRSEFAILNSKELYSTGLKIRWSD